MESGQKHFYFKIRSPDFISFQLVCLFIYFLLILYLFFFFQFQKSYPEVYQERFPTPESEALLFPEKPKPKPQLLMWALKNPFQPFQRTRSCLLINSIDVVKNTSLFMTSFKVLSLHSKYPSLITFYCIQFIPFMSSN